MVSFQRSRKRVRVKVKVKVGGESHRKCSICRCVDLEDEDGICIPVALSVLPCPDRTKNELYEYSKVLGNTQFILLPFQPYKFVYAHMLAEVGKVTESLKYCQALLKSLKTGRAPEVDTWRQLVLSLEERIRTHQQGGYSTNLAPAKLVGKLLNLFDSTAHRVVGGLPPPVPSTSQGAAQASEHYYQTMGPRVSTSQSTMAMSSLIPSDQ
ncbi:hypothetical protein LOK49_LG15G02553 [Camellia lanceoleosa]|uniref:Uncharacterized protein n=1 Tax=Camellia lanceoleosa TaxID=1840588 RepID=A0ACC0F0Y2_9ERIC|nr:hypothetical protein LOK49_LG15G02553 [Camellia lanceoleosa]